MRVFFSDADDTLAAVAEKLRRSGNPLVAIHRGSGVKLEELPAILGDAEIAVIDHTSLPTPLAAYVAASNKSFSSVPGPGAT